MHRHRNARRAAPVRLAALGLLAGVALTLGACGRENNLTVPVPSGPVTWENTIRHLLADRSSGTKPTGCTSCHHAGTGIPDWSNYGTVYSDRVNIRGRLSSGGNMRQFLDPGEPEIVIAWIDAGAPQ